MASIDIEDLSTSDLTKLEAQIEKRKKELAKENLKTASEEIKAVLANYELTLDDVLPLISKGAAKRVSKPRGKVAPKYKNPADASQTWTGRGRKPLWVIAALDSGKTLDDIAI
ncbi:H-NS histone family protein [Celeribacter arenosi]|uniref:H-NS histone family protein n=1 Tax=Celeribacter arenosi TaxID=792649 RepID=A0ABP7JZ77_9RHOB